MNPRPTAHRRRAALRRVAAWYGLDGVLPELMLLVLAFAIVAGALALRVASVGEAPVAPPHPAQSGAGRETGAASGSAFRVPLATAVASIDGELLPLVSVAASYPRAAQESGLTGRCIVEYTVTAAGATRDARAVDCHPAGAFDEASLRAVRKFKYKPRVIGGVPVEVPGVRNEFVFELNE